MKTENRAYRGLTAFIHLLMHKSSMLIVETFLKLLIMLKCFIKHLSC